MGEKRGMKALEVWCKRITEGYRDVHLDNMTTAWRDGMAFCAIIHHFRPDLIDFDSLNKDNILQNNQMAFSIAEKHLGIPALLEAEDMVKYKVPDKLSIMTYISQYYQYFQGSGQNKTPLKTTKRPLDNSMGDASSTSPPEKQIASADSVSSLQPRRHDVCQACQQRVYILERLIIDSKLYHRTCFKCCRCESVLKPGSYVEGQIPGQYECVSCPDEEAEEKAAVDSMKAARIAHLQSPTGVTESWGGSNLRKSPSATDEMKITASATKARVAFFSQNTDTTDGKSSSSVSTTKSPTITDSNNDETSKGIATSESGSKSVQLDSEGNHIIEPSEKTKGDNNDTTCVLSKEQKLDSGTADDSMTQLVDSKVDRIKSVTTASESEVRCDSLIKNEEEVDSVFVDDSSLATTVKDAHDETSHKMNISATTVSSSTCSAEQLRPVPSPRNKRKSISDQTVNKRNSDSYSDEVYLTPLPSPRHRKKLTDTDSTMTVTDDKSSAGDSVGVNGKPVPKARSSIVTKPPPPVKPKTEVGKSQIHDMPVIRPQINQGRLLSPTRKTAGHDFSSSSTPLDSSAKEKSKPTSLPPKPAARRKISIEGLTETLHKIEVRPVSPAEGTDSSKRRSLPCPSSPVSEVDRGDSAMTSEMRKSTIGMVTTSESTTTLSERATSPTSPRKIPPPRPKPPAILGADRSSTLSITSTAGSTIPSKTTEEEEEEYPDDLNPFNDEDEGEPLAKTTPIKTEDTKSLNPFGDSDEDEDVSGTTAQATSTSQVTSTPLKSTESSATTDRGKTLSPKELNPFLSDDDDDEFEMTVESSKPNFAPAESSSLYPSSVSRSTPNISPAGSVSKGTNRKLTSSPTGSASTGSGVWYSPTASPIESPTGSLSKATGAKQLLPHDKSGGSTDISPTGSLSRSHLGRKKRPAPKPPSAQQLSTSTTTPGGDSSRTSQGLESPSQLKKSPRSFKKVPAPPPPQPPSSPSSTTTTAAEERVKEVNVKSLKEMDNQNLKSNVQVKSLPLMSPDRSSAGSQISLISPTTPRSTASNWKKKKPAPPVPLPPKRQTRQIPLEELQKELTEIEEKQLMLEKQGVELEKKIREFSGVEENNPEEEELVIQLFELVNQKNVLFRRQAELVYLKRQQRLEQEHAELEFQIRSLMNKPENLKTEEDKEQEEMLINRLMDVVMQRNQIIESMETDRLREALEDQSIQEQMVLHQAAGSSRNSTGSLPSPNSLERPSKKEKKKKDKTLKFKNKEKEKSKTNLDEDKDLDDVEMAIKEKTKKEKKRRWL